MFTSCSSDGSIKVWDVRTASRCAISINAHDVDINALSWNRCEQHLLVSGADDGRFRIWDLRTFGGAAKGAPIEPVADFKWHMGPVTSVEWHPTDASVLYTIFVPHDCSFPAPMFFLSQQVSVPCVLHTDS